MSGTGDATTAMPARRPPPPWEALPLVAPFLDAASLAATSCVSTSWHDAFAADYLWARLCAHHYPSALSLLRHLPNTNDTDTRQCSSTSPHRRLFALFRSASIRRRALPPPGLALADVAFAVDITTTTGGERSILSFAVAAAEAGGVKNAAGLFVFGVDVSNRHAAIGTAGEWRVRWTAVRTTARRGDEAVLMMDTKVPAARAAGAVRFGFGGRGEAGVTERLPAPGCGGAKLEAEVVVELAGEERLVEKVRLGVMCECRYVSADEGLRYLQHFLL